MEKILDSGMPAENFEQAILLEHDHKRRIAKSLFNNAGIVMGVFLMFAVIVVVTTDMRLTSFEEVAELGMDFLTLLFLSYSMYVDCSDSGMRAGLQSETYRAGIAAYETLKKHVIDTGIQGYLGKFCRYYVEREHRLARTAVLAVAGISYQEYIDSYVGKDKETIMCDSMLSAAQKKAIVKANKIAPIRLTPEMIMKRGRSSHRRAPLGITPEFKKGFNFGTKFVSTLLISLGMSMIVLEAVSEPTWEIVATCCLKLLAVALNGFNGYKFGYENIVFDTVNYMEDQTDLMQQAVVYYEETHGKDGAYEQQKNDIVVDKVGIGAGETKCELHGGSGSGI